jgi:hypothetical protein
LTYRLGRSLKIEKTKMADAHGTGGASTPPVPTMADTIKKHPALRAARTVIEVVDVLADLGILFKLVLPTADGKKTVNPDAIRAFAPGLFKNKQHEAFYSRVLVQHPDQSVRDRIDTFMSGANLGEHQQADFILSVCEHADGDTADVKAVNLRLTHQFLTELAGLGTFAEMIARCDERNFMLRREDEYVVVKLQRFGGSAIRSIGQLATRIDGQFQTWANSSRARAALVLASGYSWSVNNQPWWKRIF